MNDAINGVFNLLSIVFNGIYNTPILAFPMFVAIMGIIASIVKQSRGE